MLTPAKRHVLKTLLSFYDHLGLIQQKIIGLKDTYAKHLSGKTRLGWNVIKTNIKGLAWLFDKIRKTLSIETHCLFETGNNTNPVKKKKITRFCDASLKGYEGCIYVKTTYKPRKISVKILSSNYSPTKTRYNTKIIELLDALLLSQFMLSVRNPLENTFIS